MEQLASMIQKRETNRVTYEKCKKQLFIGVSLQLLLFFYFLYLIMTYPS